MCCGFLPLMFGWEPAVVDLEKLWGTLGYEMLWGTERRVLRGNMGDGLRGVEQKMSLEM